MEQGDSSRRCTECRTRLEPHQQPVNFMRDPVEGTLEGYTVIWFCPNQLNHGVLVPCPNCGEDVPSSGYHYSSKPGLIGSGRYSCLRPSVLKFPRPLGDCPDHRLVQHRDGEPPWCNNCGGDANGSVIGVVHPSRGYRPPPPETSP